MKRIGTILITTLALACGPSAEELARAAEKELQATEEAARARQAEQLEAFGAEKPRIGTGETRPLVPEGFGDGLPQLEAPPAKEPPPAPAPAESQAGAPEAE